MIIGISGKIGCGKTVLGRLIARRHDYSRVSFGDLLKQEASAAWKYPLRWNYTHKGKGRTVHSTGCTVRELLQYHGTEVRRKEDPDYWVDQMRVELKTLQRFYPEGEILNVVIDDVRFPNEARMVKDMGGVLIRIQPYPEWVPGPHADHASETVLDWVNCGAYIRDSLTWDLVLTPEFGALAACLPKIDLLISMNRTIVVKEEDQNGTT